MTVFMCIYFSKQQDMSFEFSLILSTVDLSKQLITAWIIQNFIQLVNLVTFRVLEVKAISVRVHLVGIGGIGLQLILLQMIGIN